MEKEGIDVDKHDFHREDDEASLNDKDKEEVAGSSNDVEQTSAKLEEQGKAPCASTAIDMNMLLGAISQISSQLQVQETPAFMKARGLTDNIEGNRPEADASADAKNAFERNEGRAMNAIFQSLDSEHANLVLACKTTKDMMIKLNSVYEKISEIRVMTLYEEYFSLKMKKDESVAGYVAKANQLASEIEKQGEKLSEKLKMRINDEQCATEDAAFAAKFKRNEFKSESKPSIDELKRKTKCNACGQIGHWAKDKKCPKSKNSSSINKSKKRASSKDNKSLKDRDELAWSTVVRANKYDDSKSNYWCVDSGATSHMTYRREWFSELREYGGQVKLADRRHVEIRGIGTVLIDS
ncbi:uncharacterized protein LOC118733081 [Rhagoletis pomonella]|uniref:uncharacterized protein LOC118733081 n=1 Tax=Rhagoletis pomonella TaxID=28610 RepID=UPI0017816957|nr:uncharacterized protein LOC118733081 [Rhagoletis pomonella]